MSPELAHCVIFGQRNISVSFGAKRTLRDAYAAKFMSGAFVEKETAEFLSTPLKYPLLRRSSKHQSFLEAQ
jgi:hypothetical protein